MNYSLPSHPFGFASNPNLAVLAGNRCCGCRCVVLFDSPMTKYPAPRHYFVLDPIALCPDIDLILFFEQTLLGFPSSCRLHVVLRWPVGSRKSQMRNGKTLSKDSNVSTCRVLVYVIRESLYSFGEIDRQFFSAVEFKPDEPH